MGAGFTAVRAICASAMWPLDRFITIATPASSISAFRHNSAAGVSPENAAQHLVPPGATWHKSPSFLMQKPHPLRQVSDWLYHRQRVSRQMLPPMVPMLRRTGDATIEAASVKTG